MLSFLQHELAPWVVFAAIVGTAMTVDLALVGRKQVVLSPRTAFRWSLVWVGLGLGFSLAVWGWYGAEQAQQYLAGYLIEISLSIDNLFVFLVAFATLGVELRYQRSVLFWGIIAAVVLRGAFIVAGIQLIERLHLVVYLFGALLVYTAWRLVRTQGVEVDPERNPLVRLTRRLFPVAADYRGGRYVIHRDGRRYLTTVAVALVAVNSADLVFALDSVPAVLAITTHTFVAFTSNIAAVLGLRALYFALASSLERFEYLTWGLAAVLAFVGAKMLLSDVVHVPTVVSLGVVVVAIGVSVLLSLRLTKGDEGGA